MSTDAAKLAKLLPHKRVLEIVLCCVLLGTCDFTIAQTEDFNAASVLDRIQETGPLAIEPLWWQKHIQSGHRNARPITTDLHNLLALAINYSTNVRIAQQEPIIRRTEIQEASSTFDWLNFIDSSWNDLSDPVGNSLTVGPGADRLEDHSVQIQGGFRRLNTQGGQFEISERIGWQDTNSQFFIPTNQANSRLVLSYTQPLMRGRGKFYNTSVVYLAKMNAAAAMDDFVSQLQDHLLEVTNTYWELYLERANLAQQISLFLKTEKIHKSLLARQQIDTQPTQLISVASALENRRADLITARSAVMNAETRLRGLINTKQLESAEVAELIPMDEPVLFAYSSDLNTEIETAAHNRPELSAAVKRIQVAARNLGISKHELMPQLNLVTEAYTSGLRGNNAFGGAFGDQFRTTPGYSIGLQFEYALGNRAAKARAVQREAELTRVNLEFLRAKEAVHSEVSLAFREVNTTHREIGAKSRALSAAKAEAATIERRWRNNIDGPGTATLNLESLLSAQERVLAAQNEYAAVIVEYNLALIRLRRSTGTLLQAQNIQVYETNSGGRPSIALKKGDVSGSTGTREYTDERSINLSPSLVPPTPEFSGSSAAHLPPNPTP